ncbi:hypothetical protein V6N13_125120 [Hibiscus sabdariffa]|uniref:RNase H type-1 domain-containing protein n=1 Tax=Hibiscus sabdariffa TaxID=183260 RepID=A0ABR2U4S3_9ROSI
MLAIDLGFRNEIVEGDSLTIITKLKSNKEDFSEIGAITDDTRHLLRNLGSYRLSFIRRGGNKVAHELARERISLSRLTKSRLKKLQSALKLLQLRIVYVPTHRDRFVLGFSPKKLTFSACCFLVLSSVALALISRFSRCARRDGQRILVGLASLSFLFPFRFSSFLLLVFPLLFCFFGLPYFKGPLPFVSIMKLAGNIFKKE